MNKKTDTKFRIGMQYLKDLSVENPNSPYIFTVNSESGPKMEVNYDISVARLGKDDDSSDTATFEVTLKINASAKIAENSNEKQELSLFICEAKYAGICHIEGNDKEQEKKILFVNAPNMLFPFLRRIIATSTGDCGFPPLMLEPVDFATHFDQQNQS